jgi:hypothetical protein
MTPLLDWSLNPYKALYFALREWNSQPAVTVWVFHVTETTLPYCRIWDPDVFPRVNWGSVSARQTAQEGVFTRLSDLIFADLEEYLRNRIGERASLACLAKIEILASAIPPLVRELERRGIDAASLGLSAASDNQALDQIAARCNEVLIRRNPTPAAPVVPRVDPDAIMAVAKSLAARELARIGPGKAHPMAGRVFPFLSPSIPTNFVSGNTRGGDEQPRRKQRPVSRQSPS